MTTIHDVENLSAHLREMLMACDNLLSFVALGAEQQEISQQEHSPAYIRQETRIIVSQGGRAMELWREIPVWLRPFQPAPVKVGNMLPRSSYAECAMTVANSLLFFLDNPELPISVSWDAQDFQAAHKLFGRFVTADANELRMLDAHLQIELRAFARYVREQPHLESEVPSTEELSVPANPLEEQTRHLHSEDFTFVRWRDQSFQLTEPQARCMAVLWSEWCKGTPDVGHALLLQRSGSMASRISDVFKRCPAWKTAIVSSVRGVYRLADPRGDIQETASPRIA